MITWIVSHRLRIIATVLILLMAGGLFATTFAIYEERKEQVSEAKFEAELAKTRADLAAKQTDELCRVANENRQILRQVIELASKGDPDDDAEKVAVREEFRRGALELVPPIECPPLPRPD